MVTLCPFTATLVLLGDLCGVIYSLALCITAILHIYHAIVSTVGWA